MMYSYYITARLPETIQYQTGYNIIISPRTEHDKKL